jgi:AraC family transcriptional regulator
MEALEQSAIDLRKSVRNRSIALQSALRLLTEASRTLQSDGDEAQACIAKAAALLQGESDLEEMGTGTPHRSNRQRLAPWQVARVTRFIDANLSKKIGIRDFATIARLSSCHFARTFRATVGEAPYAYLIRRRIERAQELILLTDKPLAEIALDCGLADQAHMTRHFRRVMGVSPGAWRRLHGATGRDGSALRPLNGSPATFRG